MPKNTVDFYIPIVKNKDIDFKKFQNHEYALYDTPEDARGIIKEVCSDYGPHEDDFKIIKVHINLSDVS